MPITPDRGSKKHADQQLFALTVGESQGWEWSSAGHDSLLQLWSLLHDK